VSAQLSQSLLAVFLIFCRIGGCLMVAPGFSSARVPTRVRLFIALTVSLALTPLLLGPVGARVGDAAPADMLRLIAFETFTGFVIGFMARLFFMALETLAVAIAMAIGIGGMLGTPVDDGESLPSLATLITLTAVALVFFADLHWELLRGLVASYQRLPPGETFGTRLALTEVVDKLTDAFLIALRISSPFIIYSLVINFAIGVANKLTPQLPIYFIMMPLVIGLGLLIFYLLFREYMTLFMLGFAEWLRNG